MALTPYHSLLDCIQSRTSQPAASTSQSRCIYSSTSGFMSLCAVLHVQLFVGLTAGLECRNPGIPVCALIHHIFCDT